MKKETACAVCALALGAVALGTLGAIGVRQNNIASAVDPTVYTLSISDPISVDGSGNATVKTDLGNDISFYFNGYSEAAGKFASLSQWGSFNNWVPIHSIQSIYVSLASGSISLYTGWRQYSEGEIEFSSSSYLDLSGSSSGIADLSSQNPSYFKVIANGASVINSISITYSCTTPVENKRIHFTVAKPTIAGSSETTIAAENYLWISTNILDVNTYDSYCMTRNPDGSWYFDFDYVAVRETGFTYDLYLSDSSTSLDVWSYRADGGAVAFSVGEGQNEIRIDTPNFANQPVVAEKTYTLSLTIDVTSLGEKFHHFEFVYNYSNSTSDYNWKEISWDKETPCLYELDELDQGQTLYFRVYIWDNSLGAVFVGQSASSNYVLNPQGVDEERVTVSFDYPTSATNIVGEYVIEDQTPNEIIFDNQVIESVYDSVKINPSFTKGEEDFTATYNGENIRIDEDNNIIALKSGTNTKVTLTSTSGATCSFIVTVPASVYTPTEGRDQKWAEDEGWFTSTEVDEISSIGEEFFNGVDISSYYDLFHNGTKFYNSQGYEQSLFYILKDAGVNWVRLKIWVDPKSPSGLLYGGGNSDLAHTLWLAKETKAAGLKFLLDFHYSDYWTDPTHQVLPKSWNDCATKEELCSRIKSYTTNTLNEFKDEGCLPDMVQLGNEISSGIFVHKFTGESDTLDGDGEPLYSSQGCKTDSGIGTKKASEYCDYIKAASEGVDAVDSSIKKVLHWAKGSSGSAATISAFFNNMPDAYYDYAALSFYPFYCYDTVNDANGTSENDATQIVSHLSIRKPWFIAETSYPFSASSWVPNDETNFTISSWNTGKTSIVNSYPFTMEGQAHLIHDLTKAVADNGGKGIFYWEPAWVPNPNVGWAGAGSKNTWGNQGFFSFDGKALANLDLFAQMSPHID